MKGIRFALIAAGALVFVAGAAAAAPRTDALTGKFASHREHGSSDQRSDVSALPPIAQAEISAAIGHDEPAYHAAAQPHGARVQNPAQAFSVEFTSSGFDLRQGSDCWGMALRRYGRGDRLQTASATPPRANANRVEYRRGALTEWYANGPFGLEQGFTIARASGKAGEGPLTLALGLSGGLSASVDPGARGLTLSRDGAAVLHYAGLLVTDARGSELPAWLELAGREVRLRVNDAGAAYPLTIDPIVGTLQLNSNKSVCPPPPQFCDHGNAGDQFGFSVAISSNGNTVVVGAPNANGTYANSGAVYVFLKSFRFGWGSCIQVGCHDFVAKLSGQNGGAFGVSVAISGDGTTVAALVPSTPESGTVYVWPKPSTGWVSTGQQAAILSLYSPTESPCGPADQNPHDCGHDFSSSISVNGDGSTILLGYTGGVVSGQALGAVYVFARPSSGWVDSNSPVKLTASDGADLDRLGAAVSISSDDSTIAAAAPNAMGNAGALYVFVKGGSGWANATQTAELTAASGSMGSVGDSVGISSDGRTVVSGNTGLSFGIELSSGNAKALIFIEPLSVFCSPSGCIAVLAWSNENESAQLTASDGNLIVDPQISGNGNLVAAAASFQFTTPPAPGKLYLFAKPANGWASFSSGSVSPSAGAVNDQLGDSSTSGSPAIALSSDGNTLLAGAPGATIGSNANQGAAYVFLPEPSFGSSFGTMLAMAATLAWRRWV